MHVPDDMRYKEVQLAGPSKSAISDCGGGYHALDEFPGAFDFLPPYSPQLNPAERVWKLTRRSCTHNRHFAFLDDLVTAVESQFDAWAQPNDVLRRLCAIT